MSWQEHLLDLITEDARCEQKVFARVEAAGIALGFDYVTYGYRAPLPVSNPRIVMLSNYPQAWRDRYVQAAYVRVDPTVQHAAKSRAPLVWSEALFANARPLWEEAQSFGLAFGWAQSCVDGLGVRGMLTLARSHEPLSQLELDAKQQQMRCLAHVAHTALSRSLRAKLPGESGDELTNREVEVLKWTADGKSAQDIADILALSKNTVDFHIRNAVTKMQAANKTAAAVRAAMLGYLY